MAKQDSVSFRKWVPAWMQYMTGLIILIPTMLINGSYTGSSVDISGYLGVLTEDITFAYYAASAGMAVAYPLMIKLREIVNTKTIFICDLILQVCLSLICAQLTTISLIAVCSFFIGMLKAFALLEIMSMLSSGFSPSQKRSQFYSVFYPISMGLGQISLALTSLLAYTYQWQYMYYFMIVLLFVALLFVLIFLRYEQHSPRFSFKSIDWQSIQHATFFFMSVIYVSTYGKVLDWFSSPFILGGTFLAFLSLILFVRRQLMAEKPYVDLQVLRNRNSYIGYIYLFITMFFVATSSLISTYQNSVLKLDNVHTNQTYLWMIPGFIIGAIISWYWFRKRLRMRRVVALGLFCFTLSLALIYFQIHPYGLPQMLYLPLCLRGIGMMILFIAFGVYVVENLAPTQMISNAFFLIGTRSVLAPVLSASLFANWLYYQQQKSMMILSETLDMQNPIAASRYTSALKSALSQGWSMPDAERLATSTLYNAVQLQAVALSIKTILGYCLIICTLLTVASAFFPFYKVGGIKEAKTGSDMV